MLPALVLDPAVGYAQAGTDSLYWFDEWEVRRVRIAGAGRFLVAVGKTIRVDENGDVVHYFSGNEANLTLEGRSWKPLAALPQQIRSPWAEYVAEETAKREHAAEQRRLSDLVEVERRRVEAIRKAERDAEREVELKRRNRIRAANDELLEQRILPTLVDVVGRDLVPEGDAHDRITLSLDDLQRLVDAVRAEQ